ncbi:MAG: M20/M25/M40 family metallo-hydrolase [Planctomycetes bacterium]|nr:M20/M25/M40 family metallo-hydrolase [Planctomycetota bacterium]
MRVREGFAFLGLVTGLVVTSSLQAGPASTDIQKLYDGYRALAHIEALVDFGPRIAGGPAERAAAEYIAGEMAGCGLDVQIQEFPQTFYEDYGSVLEVVDGPALSPNTMLYSPTGEFLGVEIVFCGLGNPEDFEGVDVAGKIALMERGAITFASKVASAADAGAAAGIIFNNLPGNMMATLYSMAAIPAVMISQEDGQILMGLLEEGPVSVNLTVDAEYYSSTSQNVIGTLEGLHPDRGIVYIGAHYDSVWFGPGANDDGSGIGGMLEAARVLTRYGHRTQASIKFCAFGAEEVGQGGSESYVMTYMDEIASQGLGMINLDMIAVGDTLNIGNIGWADSALTEYTQEKATAMGIEEWVPWTAGTNSDHVYFEWVGVPVVFLYQFPDPNYHTAEDTLDKIDLPTLEQNGQLATAVLYDWAKNPALRVKKSGALDVVE